MRLNKKSFIYLFFYLFWKDFEICSDKNVECQNEDKIIPDPRLYNLTDDYIYVEQDWGSFFYKHIGKRKSEDAKNLCSAENSFVHLPIPRFYEENEFYRKHFGDDGLWLDISYDAMEGFISSNGQSFIRYIHTFYEDVQMNATYFHDLEYPDTSFSKYSYAAEIIYHDWIEFKDHRGIFSEWGKKDVFMTSAGEWKWLYSKAKETLLLDSVCIYNIIPDSSCSKCQNESFCRYKGSRRDQIECVCQKMTEGEFCEINLCSHCQNGGYCDTITNEIQCICPYPFFGENCESKVFVLQLQSIITVDSRHSLKKSLATIFSDSSILLLSMKSAMMINSLGEYDSIS